MHCIYLTQIYKRENVVCLFGGTLGDQHTSNFIATISGTAVCAS